MRKPIPFGKYYLLERISVGGMAEVFKAKAFGIEGFEKILAVKRILPTMAEDEDFIAMFIDEAKICGQLSHPNVCQIYELGCIDDTHFIAMEYIHGKDVLQIQNRFRKMRQAMPPQMAAYIASKICEGLDYAHRKKSANAEGLNIIHRDVSPQNILVAYEGEVKVIDFGIAKAANRSNKTQAGILKGKFGYMSPEQVRGLPLDRRSDLFAVGTVLYEMLTTERLFVGESDFSTLEKVRNVDVQLPSVLNPKIPKQLEEITMKALAKSTEDRYQWANEMADDLNRFLMSQEPMYTAKRLSHWMKTTFADDLARDTKKMELYRSIKQQDMASGMALPEEAASGPVAASVAPSGPVGISAPASGAGLSSPRNVPAAGPAPSGNGRAVPSAAASGPASTQLFSPELGAGHEVDASDLVESEELGEGVGQATMLLDPASDPDSAFGQKTMLFDPAPDDADGDGLHGQKTMLFDGDLPEVGGQKTMLFDTEEHGEPVHGQKTMLFDPSTMAPPGMGANGPGSGAAPMPGVAQPYGGYAPPQAAYIVDGTASVRMPDGSLRMLPVRRKSTLVRDIIIAMIVGFAAVAGVIVFLNVTGQVGLGSGTDGEDGEDVEAIGDEGDGEADDEGASTGARDKSKGKPTKVARAETALGVSTTPAVSEAEVFVDGERRCTAVPCTVKELESGSAKVQIIAEGYEKYEEIAKVVEGERTEIVAKLKARPKGKAKLKIDVSHRDADVTLDGDKWDPKKGFVEVSAGVEHEMRVRLKKFRTVEEKILLDPDSSRTVKVSLEPAKLTIKVTSTPVAGEVVVGGENVGLAPKEVTGREIDRSHTVIVKAEGYETFKTKVAYDGDDVEVVEAKLVPLPADAKGPDKRPGVAVAKDDGGKRDAKDDKVKKTPKTAAASGDAPTAKVKGPVAYGALVANSRPFARVIVDGKDTGKETPVTPPGLKLPAGKHTVTFRLPDGREVSFPVEIKADEVTRLVKNLE